MFKFIEAVDVLFDHFSPTTHTPLTIKENKRTGTQVKASSFKCSMKLARCKGCEFHVHKIFYQKAV